MRILLLVVLLSASVVTVRAADRPVAGTRLLLQAGARVTSRRAAIELLDSGIALPVPDPRTGVTTLVIHGGAATGQCFVAVPLDPLRWHVLGRRAAPRGYRYRPPRTGASGLKRVQVTGGRISVTARGAEFPCDLAAAQRMPLTVELRLPDTRYCAAFGGTVATNVPGRIEASGAPAPASCPKTDVTVADLNILHGIFCPPASVNCRYADRLDLLFQWIAARGCPDVVTLQEVYSVEEPQIEARLPGPCPFPYYPVYVRTNVFDDALILTRWPASSVEVHVLYKNFRNVLFARLDHPLGPLDLFSTHLASGSDGAQNPCTGDCPAECVAAGATTVRECQGVQLAGWVAARHDRPGPSVLTGDFNESPGTFVYQQMTARGWPDTYLAAGNAECVPATGAGCTSGRADEDLSQLESGASNESERIDFIFLVSPGVGTCALDSPADADTDGTATRLFADQPNPFAPTCGPVPDAVCWPSDHVGTELDLNCR